MSRNEHGDQLNNAKIYIGEVQCATMPTDVINGKLYTFEFKSVFIGDYIKIVTGRSDGNLGISEVTVFSNLNWK